MCMKLDKDKFVSKEDLTNHAKFLATKFDIEETMVDTNWIRHVISNTVIVGFLGVRLYYISE